jgi:uncharacterized membrane protein (DUF485 family)
VTAESRSSARRRAEDRNFVHYVAMGHGRGFMRLHKKFIHSTSLIVVLFLSWYGLYIAMSAYGRGVMDIKVVGNINLGIIFGVLQFASTFAVCWGRARYSRVALDPLADRLRAEIDGSPQPVPPPELPGRHVRATPQHAPRPRLGDQS